MGALLAPTIHELEVDSSIHGQIFQTLVTT